MTRHADDVIGVIAILPPLSYHLLLVYRATKSTSGKAVVMTSLPTVARSESEGYLEYPKFRPVNMY